MTIEEMKRRKRELGLSNKELSRRSSVPVGTLQKIFSGTTRSPRMASVRALERVLRNDDASAGKLPGERASDGAFYLNDPGAVYGTSAAKGKRQGEYTLEDYYAIPDERRAELIDGVLYDMSSPSNVHQSVLMETAVQLNAYVKQNNGKCRVCVAPFDVQLCKDDRTMVQPDIAVICDEEKQRRFGCYGAPDLVVEILSPSTGHKDLTVKLYKYMQAGVREYWIADPDEKKITVYRKDGDALLFSLYDFADKIPVGIWDDRCCIDLSELIPYIDHLNSLPE